MEEGQFDFAIGFQDLSKVTETDDFEFSSIQLPPQVGRWKVITSTKDSAGFVKEELDEVSHLCNLEDSFKLFDKEQ